MLDFTRPRLVAFRERVAVAVPRVPDDEATRAELFGMRIANVLGVYLNYFGRFIPARPRGVMYASRFWTPQAFRHGAEVAVLEAKIRRGEDLSEHLAPSLGRYRYTSDNRRRWEPARDLALNAFGTYHLHLRPNGGDALMFAAFSRDEARMVMVGNHRSFDDGSLSDAVAHFLVEIGATAKGLSPAAAPLSPKDQMRLARRGVSSLGTANGKVTPGPSIMSNGDGLRTHRYANFITRRVEMLDPLLDDPVQVDALMPAARGRWKAEVDFEWHLQDTDLVLYERNSRTLCPVWNGFC